MILQQNRYTTQNNIKLWTLEVSYLKTDEMCSIFRQKSKKHSKSIIYNYIYTIMIKI